MEGVAAEAGAEEPDPLAADPVGAALRGLAEAVATDPGQVHERAVEAALRVTNARCAALYVAHEEHACVLAAETGGADAPSSFTLGEEWPPIVAGSARRWSPGDPPALLPFATSPGWAAGLAARLAVGDRDHGLLIVGEPASGGYRDDAADWLATVATLAATALDHARVRAEKDELERLIAGAVEASADLVEAREPAEVRARVLDGLVGPMGFEAAAIWMRAGEAAPAGAPEPLTLAASAGLPEDVQARVACMPGTSAAARLAAGLAPAQSSAALDESGWPGRRAHLVVLPAPARGVLGVYAAQSLPPPFVGVLAALAHAVAAAERQAALHERARTLIDSLQRELRPSGDDLPAGVEAAWVYRSATRGAEVGGDFYDVFTATTGHVGVACGDVSGKGLEAASLSAMAVHTLRAFALQGTSPQIALAMLNTSACKQTALERFITLAYARVDPVSWSVTFGLAGHPPPIVVGPAGVRAVDVEPDLPVGVDPTAAYDQRSLTLGVGEALVLFTDGVTEARRDGPHGELLGLDRLVDTLDDATGASAQELADRIWAAVEDWTSGNTSDDCAIVVLRRAG